MTPKIRSATLTDVPAILQIEQQSHTAAHWSAEQYSKLVATGTILVAHDAKQICAFISAQTIGSEWEIENIAVASEFLHRGFATELLRALMKKARAQHASAIILEVRESNFAARGFYEKHEFLEVGRRPTYYQNPVEDAIFYKLSFDQPCAAG